MMRLAAILEMKLKKGSTTQHREASYRFSPFSMAARECRVCFHGVLLSIVHGPAYRSIQTETPPLCVSSSLVAHCPRLAPGVLAARCVRLAFLSARLFACMLVVCSTDDCLGEQQTAI